MEQYVYFSIIFFSLIIFFLYIYIVYEKTMEMYKNKKIENYNKELLQYIDSTIDRVKNGEDIDHHVMENLKSSCKNKYKREIIEKRLLHYLEDSKVDFSKKITKLCEYIGIVEYEINKFKSKDNLTKALAAKRLGQFRSDYGIKPLLKEINTKDNDVKYNVLLSLAKIGNEQAFISAFENIDSSLNLSERSLIEIVDSFEVDKNSIYKHMINSDSSLVACVFIKSAGNYKNMSLSSDISKYLFSEDKERRIAAVKAIGNIGDAAYLDDIIKLLEDSEWEVRAVTAKALGSFTDRKILMPLAKSLSDSQWYV
ncbi:MAG: HEAT repeat domain-containing protein, partial [Clostridiales bacterium]|nr:HEAT repeat domain-containing protein [Clostridiales bacterium]